MQERPPTPPHDAHAKPGTDRQGDRVPGPGAPKLPRPARPVPGHQAGPTRVGTAGRLSAARVGAPDASPNPAVSHEAREETEKHKCTARRPENPSRCTHALSLSDDPTAELTCACGGGDWGSWARPPRPRGSSPPSGTAREARRAGVPAWMTSGTTESGVPREPFQRTCSVTGEVQLWDRMHPAGDVARGTKTPVFLGGTARESQRRPPRTRTGRARL